MPRRRVSVPVPQTPVISNAQIAMAALIIAETMLFVGLIGGYLVFRLQEVEWPPAGLPRLPLGLTAVNTAGLVASALWMGAALGSVRAGERDAANRAVAWTMVLGVAFVLLQGVEWMRLVHHGLTLGGSVYGAAFYVLIGCHALHVVGAVVFLIVVGWGIRHGRFGASYAVPVEMCTTYWYFVTALWLVLFPLVYLY